MERGIEREKERDTERDTEREGETERERGRGREIGRQGGRERLKNPYLRFTEHPPVSRQVPQLWTTPLSRQLQGDPVKSPP